MKIGNNLPNTGEPEKPKKKEKTESEGKISVVAKNTNFGHSNHIYTVGFKYEDKVKMTDTKIGNLPVKTSLSFFNHAALNAGKGTILAETAVATGKVQYNISPKSNVYLKGDLGTLNVGHFDGKVSAGIGFRGALGIEVGKFFVEGFKEEYTNNYSNGLTIGAKF